MLLFLVIPGIHHGVVQRPKYAKKMMRWWQARSRRRRRHGRGSVSGSVSSTGSAGSTWSAAVMLTGLGRAVGARTSSVPEVAEVRQR